MKKIDIHLHAALDPVPGTEKFKISTGEEMLAHLEELQIEKGCYVIRRDRRSNGFCLRKPEMQRNWPEDFLKKYVWM